MSSLGRAMIISLFCIVENTRAAYPIEYIPNVKLPCVGPHPKNVILLACDAFGVLPPVSKLSLSQTMYHFISGYTALVMSNSLSYIYLSNIYESPTKTPDMTLVKCQTLTHVGYSETAST